MTSDFLLPLLPYYFSKGRFCMQDNLSLYHIFYTVARTGSISTVPGPLYQPACYQQVDPEAGAESGYRSF